MELKLGDEPNPLMALLAQKSSGAPTVLDLHYQQLHPIRSQKATCQSTPPLLVSQAEQQNSPNLKQSPVQGASNKITNGQNPTPTKSSSADNNAAQASKNQNNTTSNITPQKKEKSSEDEDQPMGLGIRQPSFNSLLGQVIPKGGNGPTNLDDIIQEIPEESQPHLLPKNDEADEEDEDPQVAIVKHLAEKNESKWAAMGYEPPQNLVPMVRAHSQARLNEAGAGIGLGVRQSSLAKFYAVPEGGNPITSIATVPEEPPEQKPVDPFALPQKTVPTPNYRKRSGSFGMKLGEASESQARIHTILPDVPDSVEPILENNNDSDNDENNEEEEEEEEGLFGRLDQIVKEDSDSPIYQFIASGDKPKRKNAAAVREAITKYMKIAKRKKWTNEVNYLSELLDIIPVIKKKTKKEDDEINAPLNVQPPTRKKPAALKKAETNTHPKKTIGKVTSRKKGTSLHLHNDEYEDTDMKIKRALARIDADYEVDCAELECHYKSPEVVAEYSKPSAALLQLQARFRRLRRAHKDHEALQVQRRAEKLADKEGAEAERRLQADLAEDQRKLDERYEARREIARMKAALRTGASLGLPVHAPPPLDRASDISILHSMTDAVLEGRELRNISIDRMYRKKKGQCSR